MAQEHKAGFVNIVGNPNVGKSTLMNALVGERVSIITSKAQTTRHRIMGILNTPEYQIVFSDTPGVLSPKYKLQESMLDASEGALTDADILLYVTDVVENPTRNAEFLANVAKETVPVLREINKIDLVKEQPDLEAIADRLQQMHPSAEIFPRPPKLNSKADISRSGMLDLWPDPPPNSGKDARTEKPHRFFVTETTRRKSCSTMTKRCLTALRSSSKNLTRRMHPYTSWLSYTWSVIHRRPLS